MSARVVVATLALSIAAGAKAVASGPAAPAVAPVAPSAVATSVAFYAIRINGLDVSRGVPVARNARGELFLTPEDLREFGFAVDADWATALVDGQAFVSLRNFAGLVASANERAQRLDVVAPPSLFVASHIAIRDDTRTAQPSRVPSAFLNYESFGRFQRGGDTADTIVRGGVSGNFGVATTSFSTGNRSSATGRTIRLETTLQRDDLTRDRTLRIGDTLSDGGRLGSTIQFAGIAYGTNFALDPNLVRLPLLDVQGLSSTPSVVDVFVNGVRQQQTQVPTGPFALNTLPTVDGEGHVQLVVTDIFGRQRVITQDYYASARLLRKGLAEFDASAGAQRSNYGSQSFGYGPAFASATGRRGFSDRFTGEAHAEASAAVQSAAFVGDVAVPRLGLFSAGLAASEARGAGAGVRGNLGYQYQVQNRYTLEANVDAATGAFATIAGTAAPLQLQLDLLSPLGESASVNVAYTSQTDAFGNTRAASVGYSLRRRRANLNVALTKSLNTGTLGATASLRIAMGERSSATATSALGAGARTALRYREYLPPSGIGMGYAVGTQAGDGRFDTASVEHADRYGTQALDLARDAREVAFDGTVAGGIVAIGGHVFPTREVVGSYGLAVLDGYPGVHLFANGQDVGTTDRRGELLVPNLSPYQQNFIDVSDRDLPISANVDELERRVVPYFRSGTIVRFKTRAPGAVRFHVDDAAGAPLAAGSTLADADDATRTYPVGPGGFAYVAGARPGPLHLIARGDGAACRIDAVVPADTASEPDLGRLRCTAVAATAAVAGVSRPGSAAPRPDAPVPAVAVTLAAAAATAPAARASSLPSPAASVGPSARVALAAPTGTARLLVRFRDGRPLPTGATLFLSGDTTLRWTTGTGGRATLDGVPAGRAVLLARVDSKNCRFALVVGPGDSAPEARTAICR